MIKFTYDMFGNIEYPTIILSTKYHKHLGTINNIDNDSIECSFNLNSAQEISFDVYKKFDGKVCELWDSIVDLKYIYVPDYKEYYEISISTNEDNKTIKHVTATSACEAELSTRKLRNFECNTETDIARDDYVPTVFYNGDNPEASLLHRVLKDKCPDYSIGHVDSSLMQIQRIFSADDIDIYSFLTSTVAEEIECLFIFDSMNRTISAYDLKNVCKDCGARTSDIICPSCNSTNLSYFGEDTGIFISKDNFANMITVEGDSDNIFNCLRVEGGDDLVTATVANINPNGSNYIYNFSQLMLEDMPDELVEKIKSYNDIYNSVEKQYQEYANKVYELIDKELYLTSEMMPTVTTPDTTAENELNTLISQLNTVSVQSISTLSQSSADLAVKNFAEAIIDPRYKVEIKSSLLSGVNNNTRTWKGRFIVTNIGDSDDTDVSDSDISVVIRDNDYEEFLYQKIQKTLERKDSVFYSIFEIEDINIFNEELKKYCLDSLKSFESSYHACLEILIQNGVRDKNSVFYGVNIYNTMYLPYYNRILSIQSEIKIRENEISEVSTERQEYDDKRKDIQNQLNFKDYIGDELWIVFSHYLREDTYSNSNYISDGLSNSELIESCAELFNTAKDEVIKTSTLQYTLSSSLNNLLNIKEFSPFKEKFNICNWINLMADDMLYKLRLITINISFGSLDKISVEFSNVTRINNIINDAKSIMSQVKNMSGSYDYISHQATNGNNAKDNIDNWVEKGLSSAIVRIKNNDNEEITYDDHGLSAKSYDDILDDYSPEKLIVTHNMIAFTDDNWLTSSAALGKHTYTYYDDTKKDFLSSEGYGLSAKFVQAGYVYGSQIIGGSIYSSNYSSTSGTYIDLLNGNFSFAGGKMNYDGNTFTVNAKIIATSGKIGGFTIGNNAIYNGTNSNTSTIEGIYLGTNGIRQYKDSSHYVDIKNGVLTANGAVFSGKITSTSGSIGGFIITSNSLYNGTNSNISANPGVYVGTDGIRQYKDATQYIDMKDGVLTAQNANISGTINTARGSIGGWNINSSSLSKDYGNYRAYIQTPSADDKWVFSTQTKKDDGKYYATFYVKADGSAYFGNEVNIVGDTKIYGSLEISGDTVFTGNKWIYIGTDNKHWLPRTYGETEVIDTTRFNGITDVYATYNESTGKTTLAIKFYNVPFNGGDGNKNYFTYYIDLTDKDFSYSYS